MRRGKAAGDWGAVRLAGGSEDLDLVVQPVRHDHALALEDEVSGGEVGCGVRFQEVTAGIIGGDRIVRRFGIADPCVAGARLEGDAEVIDETRGDRLRRAAPMEYLDF